MSFPLPLTDGAFIVDNSTLEKFDCLRKGQYYVVDKRQTTGNRHALDFGKAIHAALAVRYLEPEINSIHLYEHKQLLALAKEFEKILPPNDDHRTLDYATSLIQQYNAQYCFEPFTVIRHGGYSLCEVPFAVSLGVVHLGDQEIPVVWKGRIDLGINQDGRKLVVDHKTTSMMGDQFFKGFALSSQMIGYVFSLSVILGERVQGALINALATRKPTKSGKGIEFERSYVAVDDFMIEEWKQDVLHRVLTFLQGCQEGYLPKSPSCCAGKFGLCEYFDVCTLSSNKEREFMLSTTNFQDVTWDPLTSENNNPGIPITTDFSGLNLTTKSNVTTN